MKNAALSKLMTFKQPRVQKLLIGLYVLVILGISATVRAETQKAETYRGQVVMTVDQRFFLVNEAQTQAVELRSTEDLSGFNGYIVNVLGTELKHKVGPAELLSMDPLQMDEEQLQVVPVVLVLDIGVEKHLGIETK